MTINLNRIRACVLGLAASVLVFSTAKADLIAYEGFDYTVGDPMTNQSGGFGWGAAWVDDNNGEVGNGLSYAGLTTVGGSGSSRYSSPVIREFDTTPTTGAFASYLDGSGNIGQDDTTLWFSFLTDASTLPRIGFQRDGTDIFSFTDDNDIWRVGSGLTGNYATNLGSTATPAVQMWIGQFTFASGNDSFSIWRNPDLSQPLGAATASGTAVGDLSFDMFRYSDAGNNVIYLDEIRIGESSLDIGVIPEPGTLSLLLPGMGILFMLRRRFSSRSAA